MEVETIKWLMSQLESEKSYLECLNNDVKNSTQKIQYLGDLIAEYKIAHPLASKMAEESDNKPKPRREMEKL